MRGEPARAARLWGAAQALRDDTGIPMSPFLRSHYDYEGYFGAARSRLDEAAWEAAWAEGKAMTPEEAVEYALLEKEKPTLPTAPAPEHPPAGEPPDELTRREQQVATLIGRGLTNREIAEELGIAERTVETHVGKILRKLGFRSRTQIVAWVMEQV